MSPSPETIKNKFLPFEQIEFIVVKPAELEFRLTEERKAEIEAMIRNCTTHPPTWLLDIYEEAIEELGAAQTALFNEQMELIED